MIPEKHAETKSRSRIAEWLAELGNPSRPVDAVLNLQKRAENIRARMKPTTPIRLLLHWAVNTRGSATRELLDWLSDIYTLDRKIRTIHAPGLQILLMKDLPIIELERGYAPADVDAYYNELAQHIASRGMKHLVGIVAIDRVLGRRTAGLTLACERLIEHPDPRKPIGSSLVPAMDELVAKELIKAGHGTRRRPRTGPGSTTTRLDRPAALAGPAAPPGHAGSRDLTARTIVER